MQNPFESGHIKNYIMAYLSVVVIMVLFFIASSLFLELEDVQKKVFYVDENVTLHKSSQQMTQEDNTTSSQKFQLLKKGY